MRSTESAQDCAFPQKLLGQPPEARLHYFKSFTITHPLLREADATLKQAIQEPAGWSLIFVYGPIHAQSGLRCVWLWRVR
jgi:hypothetical protein